ncbi:MAG TPA: SdrD B-like domain-containing protein [Longilinea sp.]|nr:SdrD B-like domain-containing protein [Longilinea sp.]
MKNVRLSILIGMLVLVISGCAGSNDQAQVGNWIWEDLNQNGIQDDGEEGIDNVQVTLLTADGTMVDRITTGADGIYVFSHVPAGDYRVSVDAPFEWFFSPMDAGNDDERDSDFDPDMYITEVFHVDPSDDENTIDAGMFYYVFTEYTPTPEATYTPEEPTQCRCSDPGVVLEPNPCTWDDAGLCSGWTSLCHENGVDPEGLFSDGTQLCAFGCCVVLHCP